MWASRVSFGIWVGCEHPVASMEMWSEAWSSPSRRTASWRAASATMSCDKVRAIAIGPYNICEPPHKIWTTWRYLPLFPFPRRRQEITTIAATMLTKMIIAAAKAAVVVAVEFCFRGPNSPMWLEKNPWAVCLRFLSMYISLPSRSTSCRTGWCSSNFKETLWTCSFSCINAVMKVAERLHCSWRNFYHRRRRGCSSAARATSQPLSKVPPQSIRR